MRKYIIGALVGFCLSFALGANAEVLKDKIVQDVIPVFINGEQVPDAILVNEKAYAPLREVGEKAGYTVEFGEDRVIRMNDQQSVTDVTYTEEPSTDPVPTIKPKTIDQLNESIRRAKANVWSMKAVIETDGEKNSNYQTYKDRLTKYEAELADLEKQKAALSQ